MIHLRPALVFALFFAAFAAVFALVVTGIGQTLFPRQAGGSLVRDAQGQVIGSELIGQLFQGDRYFHPRPSAAGSGYDAANSSGTNLGPNSRRLLDGAGDGSFLGVNQLSEQYRRLNSVPTSVKIPADAVTRSGSGLDPHISLRNAELQAPRVARARGMDEDAVRELIRRHVDPAFLGIFGEPAVHVLNLNRALDAPR